MIKVLTELLYSRTWNLIWMHIYAGWMMLTIYLVHILRDLDLGEPNNSLLVIFFVINIFSAWISLVSLSEKEKRRK